MVRSLVKPALATCVLIAGLLGLGSSVAQAAATTDMQNLQLPVQNILPAVGGCSNNGETINVSGTAHVIFRSVTDAAGGTHVESFRLNLQDVVGVGADSGAVYRVVRSD